jgi:hypothetical protein
MDESLPFATDASPIAFVGRPKVHLCVPKTRREVRQQDSREAERSV